MKKKLTTKKAERLINENKIKLLSNNRMAIFEVIGDNDTYNVMYNKVKNNWSCSCRGGSLKPGTNCSHIKAAQALYNEKDN